MALSPDVIMAISVSVGVCLGLLNTWALVVDGAALGVRPYAAAWVGISNALLGIQLLGLGQVATAAAFLLSASVNFTNASLIAWHQWFKS